MAGDIKQKIVLEGEQEYSRALKEAQRNLRVLRSELKAESAELGKNATEQQKNAVKVKNLQQQIKEQEQIVKTYEAALQEVREKYADNEDAIARWEIKLNDARTALANMRNGLEDTGKSFDTVAAGAENGVSASHDLAESLEKIADVGESISGRIESAFSTIVDNIKGAITALWGELMDISARANNWTDIGAMFGTSAAEIQQWARATGDAGKEFDSLVKMGQKILTDGDPTKIAEALGVDIRGYTNQWDAFIAVMRELATMDQRGQLDALEHIGIKGAKEAGWVDVLNAWGDIERALPKYDANNGGLGLTDEQLAKANELALAAERLEGAWTALKDYTVINLFGDLALKVTGNLEQIVVAFDKYFKAGTPEERAEALAEIEQNITEIFDAVRAAFEKGIGLLGELANNLKESDDPMARALGEMLEKLVGTLEWFAKPENWQAVETGFKAIIGVWATGKIGMAVGNLTSFAAHIGTITASHGLTPTTTPTATPTDATGTGGTTVVPWYRKILSSDTLRYAAGATAFISVLGKNAFNAQGNDDILDAYGRITDEAAGMGWRKDENGETYNENVGIQSFEAGMTRGESLALREMEDLERKLSGEGGEYTEPTMLSQAQVDALQAYWDMNRSGEYDRQTYVELEEAFGDNLELMNTLVDALDELPESDYGSEDIPADWWMQQTAVQRELPSKVEEAAERAMIRGIVSGMRGITVDMDGETVGRLITPYVSAILARDLVE